MNTYKCNSVRDDFQNALKNNVLIIIYDIETTGLSAEKNHIIQIAAKKCFTSENGLEAVEEMCWYMNPGYALPDTIKELTGITDEFLADMPFEAELIDEIAVFFDTEAVCGYCNDKFDNKFMTSLFERYGYAFSPVQSVDIYNVAKDLISPKDICNYKLRTVVEYFGFGQDIAQFHNAESDTLATMLCANQFASMYLEMEGSTYENLIRCSVKNIAYWENPRNWKQKRIYVETDNAVFYYDILNRIWCMQDTQDRIGRYDMDEVVFQALLYTCTADLNEFSKFKDRLIVSE